MHGRIHLTNCPSGHFLREGVGYGCRGYRGQCYCVNNGDVTNGLFSGVYIEMGGIRHGGAHWQGGLHSSLFLHAILAGYWLVCNIVLNVETTLMVFGPLGGAHVPPPPISYTPF